MNSWAHISWKQLYSVLFTIQTTRGNILNLSPHHKINMKGYSRQKDNEENQHQEQCNSVPLIGFDPSIHGIHVEPCYKKFTKIISVSHKQNTDEAESTKIKQKKSDKCVNTVWLFLKTCVFCNQQRKSVNKTVYTFHKITTNDAMESVKKAAEIKNEEQLLLRIRDVDLIAKEMQMHI